MDLEIMSSLRDFVSFYLISRIMPSLRDWHSLFRSYIPKEFKSRLGQWQTLLKRRQLQALADAVLHPFQMLRVLDDVQVVGVNG